MFGGEDSKLPGASAPPPAPAPVGVGILPPAALSGGQPLLLVCAGFADTTVEHVLSINQTHPALSMELHCFNDLVFPFSFYMSIQQCCKNLLAGAKPSRMRGEMSC